MMTGSFLLLLTASVPPQPLTAEAPIIRLAKDPKRWRFVAWTPGEIFCGGRPIEAVHLESPTGFAFRRFSRSFKPAKVRFDIDERGRPVSIGFESTVLSTGASADILPSLAASQFSGGALKRGCEISYTPELTERDEAAPKQLARHGLYSLRGRLPRSTWKRISPGDCTESRRPVPLIRHYPDRREMAQHEGRSKWSYVGFDLDPNGVPTNLSILATSGDATLDTQSLDAVAASRYDSGDRTGCAVYFAKSPGILDAPSAPAKETIGTGPESCTAEGRWSKKPTLKFPETYRRRAIEGWAVVRYDVAPWGAVGNIEVIDAQPTEEFGADAKRLLRTARFNPLDTGLKGCTERVIYRLNRKQYGDAGEEPEPGD